MRVTLALLGWELDLTLGPATTEAADDTADPAAPLSGGLLASTPMGFTAAYDVPEEVTMPQRVPPWDDEE